MGEKITTRLYQLNKKVVDYNPFMKPFESIIDIDYLTKYLQSRKYNLQKKNDFTDNDFDFYLFHKRDSTKVVWKNFISTIADKEEDVLKNETLPNESYVLLIKSKTDDVIYATTGGKGYIHIQKFCNQNFGLEILSRIIKKDQKVLKAAKERNLIGGIIGEVKFFRNDYNLFENESFGNIYQELQASLDEKILFEEFGFSKLDLKKEKHTAEAKSSFSIKKTISFEQFVALVKKIDYLLKSKKPIIDINNIIKISKNENSLLSDLDKELLNQIKMIYANPSHDFDIEICHYDFSKYKEADNFSISINLNEDEQILNFKELYSLKMFFNEIREFKITEETLLEVINSNITSTDYNGNILTEDSLRNHFFCEISLNGKSYFLLNNEWFQIKPTFIEQINEHSKEFIQNNKFLGSLKPWKRGLLEGDYNELHIGEKNTLVLDKILPSNIEACDLLKWDNDNVYFIHVKNGFGQNMRDLTSQVLTSARYTKEALKTDGYYLSALYDRAKTSNEKVKEQFDNISKSQFLETIKNKKLVYVLAVSDNSNRDISDVEKFKSNIAKFSLINLVNSMKNFNIELKIHQINVA